MSTKKHYIVIWNDKFSAINVCNFEPEREIELVPLLIQNALGSPQLAIAMGNFGLEDIDVKYFVTRNWFRAKLTQWANG